MGTGSPVKGLNRDTGPLELNCELAGGKVRSRHCEGETGRSNPLEAMSDKDLKIRHPLGKERIQQ
jgi:hypothetical protein